MDLRANVDCFYFRQGTCRSGDGCPFRHDKSKAVPEQTDRFEGPCKFFLQGFCARGEHCFFKHPSMEEQANGNGTIDVSKVSDPKEKEELLRQKIRERMSQPLSVGPGPNTTPLKIRPVQEPNISVEFSPAKEPQLPEKLAAQTLPAQPKPDSPPKQKIFGAAARKRAEQQGVILKKPEDPPQKDVTPPRKRQKAPIVWGAQQPESEPKSEDRHTSPNKKARVEQGASERADVNPTKKRPEPTPSPAVSKPSPIPELRQSKPRSERTPIAFNPQKNSAPTASALPAASLPPVQKRLERSNGAPATTSQAPTVPSLQLDAPKAPALDLQVARATNTPSTPKSSGAAATPKSATPRTAQKTNKLAGDDELDLEDIDADIEDAHPGGGDTNEFGDIPEPEDDELDELAEDELADLEAEFS